MTKTKLTCIGFSVLALSFAVSACSSSSSSKKKNTGTTAGSGGTTASGGSGTDGGGGAGGSSGGAGGTSAGGSGGTSAGGSGGSADSGGGTPSITITDPTANETLSFAAGADPDYDVAFTVQNFTLKAPGTCAGAASCGHVHLLVDGSACNDVANHAPYNNAGAASPIPAGFDYCPTMAGAHTIKLELHNDDHSAVKDSSGATVSDSVDVTVVLADAGASDGGTDSAADATGQ